MRIFRLNYLKSTQKVLLHIYLNMLCKRILENKKGYIIYIIIIPNPLFMFGINTILILCLIYSDLCKRSIFHLPFSIFHFQQHSKYLKLFPFFMFRITQHSYVGMSFNYVPFIIFKFSSNLKSFFTKFHCFSNTIFFIN